MSSLAPELVQRLQQSDVSAFDTIYWQFHEAVYRNILKFTKEPEAAEDILQEVFTRLWIKRADLDSSQSVAGWLFVISFNLSIDFTRKRLKEQTLHKKILSISPLHSVPLESNNNYEEHYLLLQQAIEQLSPQKRKIVTLCKLEGKTYEEAACELQISRHTVKEHLSVAMVKLNEYMRKNAAQVGVALLWAWLH
jgi:RNA polymerase sigma-70 factor (ECF subfamily)